MFARHPSIVVAGLVPRIRAATTRVGCRSPAPRLGAEARHKAGHGVVMSGVAAIVCLFPMLALAQGCGPTRLKVTESVALDRPPAAVWAMIGDFQDMSWDADTVATKGAGGNVPDKATRTITLRGGASFGESLYKYDAAAMSYSYHIDTIDVAKLPVQNVSATLEVVPLDGGAKSLVRWRGAFYRYLVPGEPAPDVADANAAKAMSDYLRSGLAGLKAKAEART
jgi:hypothetical protein